MVEEIRPYQLVEIHSQAKSSRVNSWLFSLLAVMCGVGGFGFWFSNVQFKDQLAIGCFGGTLFLASRASQATKDAEKYGHRWTTLQQASEDAYLSNLVRSVQPSLPAFQVAAPLQATGNPMADAVLAKLAEFEVFPQFEKAITGASFTRLMMRPGRGQPINLITGKAAELQVALGLDKPPLMATKSGGVAIDVPNANRQILNFFNYVKPETWTDHSQFKLAVGVNLENQLVDIDLADPNSCHVLGGGTTGSGKSKFLQSLLLSLIARYSPGHAQFTIIDVKRVTFPEFEDTAYTWHKTAKDSTDAVAVLEKLEDEMENRYLKFEEARVEDLASYNAKNSPLPRIILLIDEFADLIDSADDEEKKDIDVKTRRLAQKARAAGIHLLVFTQRPDTKTLNPKLRSNLPASIGLKVQRQEESTIIMGLAGVGAENLLGKGDLLLRVGGEMERLQSLLAVDPKSPESERLCQSLINRYPKADRAPEPPKPEAEPQLQQEQPKPQSEVTWLERCLETPIEETAPAFPRHLDLILECAKSKGGRISVREAQRYPGLANKHTAEQIRSYFLQLEELTLGKVVTDDRYGGRTLFELPEATPEVIEPESNEAQHWTEKLEAWLQVNPNPTDVELKRQLKALTGLLLDDNGVAILRGELGI